MQVPVLSRFLRRHSQLQTLLSLEPEQLGKSSLHFVDLNPGANSWSLRLGFQLHSALHLQSGLGFLLRTVPGLLVVLLVLVRLRLEFVM